MVAHIKLNSHLLNYWIFILEEMLTFDRSNDDNIFDVLNDDIKGVILNWLDDYTRWIMGMVSKRFYGMDVAKPQLSDMIVYAVSGGYVSLVKMLRHWGVWWKNDITVHAAASGNLELVTWMVSNGAYIGVSTINRAAERGDMTMTEWLCEKWCPINGDTMGMAANSGNKELVMKLHTVIGNVNYCKGVYYSFIKNKDVEMIKWLFDWGYPYGADVLKWVMDTGDVAFVKQFMEITEYDLMNASIPYRSDYGGNIELLKWLDEYDYIQDRLNDVYFDLSSGGYLEALKWLYTIYTIGEIADVSTAVDSIFTGAIVGNHLHIMKWIYSLHEMKLRVRHSRMAAQYGTIEMLKWILEQGCLCGDTVISGAAKHDKMENLVWLVENGYPVDVELCWDLPLNQVMLTYFANLGRKNFKYVVRCAINDDRTDILEWYKSIGGKFTPKLYKYLANNKVPILRDWCREQDYLRDFKGAKSAIRCENVALLWEYIDHHARNDSVEDFDSFMQKVYDIAIEYESNAIMKNLIKKDVVDKKNNCIMKFGLYNHNLDIIKWGYENGYVLRVNENYAIPVHIKEWIESIGAAGKNVIYRG